MCESTQGKDSKEDTYTKIEGLLFIQIYLVVEGTQVLTYASTYKGISKNREKSMLSTI